MKTTPKDKVEVEIMTVSTENHWRVSLFPSLLFVYVSCVKK